MSVVFAFLLTNTLLLLLPCKLNQYVNYLIFLVFYRFDRLLHRMLHQKFILTKSMYWFYFAVTKHLVTT
jgi:hypothetical protein